MKKAGPIIPNPDVLSRTLDDEIVLYDTKRGRIHFLNETASQVWGLCDGTRGHDEVVVQMLERFEVPRERMGRDLEELLETLSQQELISQS